VVGIEKKGRDSTIGVFSLIEFSAASLSTPIARPLIFFPIPRSRFLLRFILFYFRFTVNERAQPIIKT